jgi:thiol-disulfide isomerase/thioredoxin
MSTYFARAWHSVSGQGIAIAAIILLGIFGGGVSALPDGVEAGDRFPELGAFALEGDVPACDGKVVLVDFWASWCGPCKQSFPVLDALTAEYGARGLVVLGVSVDEEAAAMERFLERHPVEFATVRDVEHKLVAACAVEAMPTSFLIDGQGVVRFVHRGFRGAESAKELREHIEQLLAGTKGGVP